MKNQFLEKPVYYLLILKGLLPLFLHVILRHIIISIINIFLFFNLITEFWTSNAKL